MKAAIFATALTAILATMSHAAIHTVNFSGTVDSVDSDLLGGPIAVGDTLTGSYTFDTTTTANGGSTSAFAVYNALQSLGLSVGGYNGTSTGAAEIQVDDNPSGAPNDRYAVNSSVSGGLTALTVNAIDLFSFGFRLDDSTNTVFSSAIPLPATISLSDFTSNSFFFFFGDIANPDLITGTLSSVTTTAAIPEASSLIVFGGLAAMALCKLILPGVFRRTVGP